MHQYHVIGIMSGTSLDGVDIAFCSFSEKANKWTYRIEQAETISYDKEWKSKLSSLENESAFNFVQTHIEYGHFLGKLVKEMIDESYLNVDFVSSHGHTIFHQPNKRFTFQIGAGATIAAECKLPVVCDFRSLDVALGGQGAPLVPIGDHLLFNEYTYCLNLGGFANVSFEADAKRIAFDICPVNIVTNQLCRSIGKEMDDKGEIGRTGNIHEALLHKLNELAYYQLKKNTPKSLGKEWVMENFYPILHQYTISVPDQLRTIYEHVALQIAKATESTHQKNMLITGGGAYNIFLMERITALTKHAIVLPDKHTIEFKEALIFAFLGVLRMREEINCLKSVTGALKNSVGGCVYFF